ncbi:MAG: hypothetical protein EOP84_11955 [Verrucomicrobiaceae bacterium]|nr:MAG: hypothetical protein EOP84_11955 [Verrucomicrobiaceae bacterium]
MRYSALAAVIQSLEAGWRRNALPRNPHLFPSHLRVRDLSASSGGKAHNIQYFALANRTWDEDLPIVVQVGANHTQGTQTIPDQTPAYSKAIKAPPLVEDQILASEKDYIECCNRNRPIWKSSALCSPTLGNPILQDKEGKILPYHSVMTYLSPWITTDSWDTISGSDGRNIITDLLSSPPSRDTGGLRYPFDHIRELKERLDRIEKARPILWIGHGEKHVWEHFRILMMQMGVTEWLLTGPLGEPKRPSFLERPRRFDSEYREKGR